MSGAAQRDEMLDEVSTEAEFALEPTGTDGAALRQVASERLAEHRRRRAEAQAEQQAVAAEAAEHQTRKRGGASRVRDAVAARYQQSVSYHEFLAQEAERALQQAHAEAEVANRKAKAVADAQIQLLEELEQWKQTEPGPRAVALAQNAAKVRGDLASSLADIVEAATEAMHLHPRVESAAASEAAPAGLTVRLYEELGSTPAANKLSRHTRNPIAADEHESSALDEEIAFRLAPEFEPQVAPEPISVSGNVIEFPRQLVASRKARPRIAEGPLREESGPEPQLRIFEVEPEQISIQPVAEPAAAPEWQGILLESARRSEPVAPAVTEMQFSLQPQTAPLELRLMAIAVDACCVAAAFVSFVAVFAKLAGATLHSLTLPLAGIAAAVVLGVFFILYQLLFFTFADGTPGMRYARIGLCTFGDGNPSRAAMRRRIFATLIAACPLGLGIAWAWMDEDGLGWHDRMSRMYQRGY